MVKIIFDKEWWSLLSAEQRLRFEQLCVDVLDEHHTADGLDYRVLMDLHACTVSRFQHSVETQ